MEDGRGHYARLLEKYGIQRDDAVRRLRQAESEYSLTLRLRPDDDEELHRLAVEVALCKLEIQVAEDTCENICHLREARIRELEVRVSMLVRNWREVALTSKKMATREDVACLLDRLHAIVTDMDTEEQIAACKAWMFAQEQVNAMS